MTDAPLQVAFADIANAGWTAGANYYHNLFSALRSLGEAAPRLVLVRWPHSSTVGYDHYRGLVDTELHVPPEPPPAPAPGFWGRQWRRLERVLRPPEPAAPKPPRLAAWLAEHAVNALFVCWGEFGPHFNLPVLGWIPDYQHVHLPELFSAEELRYRDRLFAAMAANNSRIILSSEDAQRDFERFSPEYAHKARVLRFVVQPPPDVYAHDPAWITEHYHLPERFVYLPDQFWRHKNHELVLHALARLKRDCPEAVVVCTGNPSDNRNRLYFGELLAQVSRLGVRDQFIVLGWVPHAHIFSLMRQSLALLQPSRFEGWSTTVEEAKSLGKRLVLSDIAVHREQDPPGALFFDPSDPDALAECLRQVFATGCPGPDEALEAQARAALPGRTRAFAETFVNHVREAVAAP